MNSCSNRDDSSDTTSATTANGASASPVSYTHLDVYKRQELFQRHLGLDPHRTSAPALAACAERQNVPIPPGMPADDLDPWLDLLLTHCIEPELGPGRLTFVYDYPASQAALARLRPGDPPVGERFELYVNGVELANGFHELGDAEEQRRRFERENAVRQASGLPVMAVDEHLLALSLIHI